MSKWVSEWVLWIRPSLPSPLIHALLLSECCCRSPHIINQLFTSSLLMFNEWGCCGQLLMNCGRGEKAQRRGQNRYCTQSVCMCGHAYRGLRVRAHARMQISGVFLHLLDINRLQNSSAVGFIFFWFSPFLIFFITGSRWVSLSFFFFSFPCPRIQRCVGCHM